MLSCSSEVTLRCTLQIKPLKKLTWHSSCYNLFGNSIRIPITYPVCFLFLHFIISTYCILMLYINSLTNINEKTELITFSFFMLLNKPIKIPKIVNFFFIRNIPLHLLCPFWPDQNTLSDWDYENYTMQRL